MNSQILTDFWKKRVRYSWIFTIPWRENNDYTLMWISSKFFLKFKKEAIWMRSSNFIITFMVGWSDFQIV